LGSLDYSDTSIYDEIYGYIPITKVELEIIDGPVFQRLNHIRQLGTAYRVFPGAQHTRFSHSLGVMHIMDHMINSKNLRDKMDADDRQKLRLAALLHDVGHYPLSHVIETVMTDHNTREERKHEKMSEYVVTHSAISDILGKYGYEPKEIAQVFTGESSEDLFNQLMSSDLDADRIDYLLRDSIHTGVAYGKFDLDRLIHTLALDKHGLLCVEQGGKHAAEGYIIGRYHMWATVYTHRVINAFNELIQHVYEGCMGDDKLFYSYEALQKLILENEEEFAKYDDHYFFNRAYGKESEGTCIDDMITMLSRRIVLKVAGEGRQLSREEKGSKGYFLLDRYKNEANIADLAERSGVPKDWIFHNNSRSQLLGLKPLLLEWPLEEEVVEQVRREMSKALRILNKDGSSTALVQDQESIVYHLRNMSLDIVRIYTKEEYQQTLEDYLKKELAS